MGNQAQIIIQPRLTIYGEIMPLSTLKDDLEINVTTRTEDDVPSTTKLEKQKVTEQKDLIVNFQIPAKLKSIEIRVKCSAKSANKTHDLGSSHNIQFDNNKNSYKYIDIFLQKNDKNQYISKILGKNGEPKKNLEVEVNLSHLHIEENIFTTLKTDDEGSINLGVLKDIVGVSLQIKAIPNLDIPDVRRLFVLEDKRQSLVQHLPSSILICQDEELRINNVNFEVDKKNYTFLKVFETNPSSDSQNQYALRVIQNELSLLKTEQDSLCVAKSQLQPGQYFLRIKPLKKNITIRVLSAKRWIDSYSIQNSYTLHDQNAGKQKKQNPFSIKSISQNDGNVKIQFDKGMSKFGDIKVHGITYTFYDNKFASPGNFNLDFYQPQSNSENIFLMNKQNTLMSNRKLGDEFAYVLNRKDQTRFTGNSLEKPSIVLKRNFVQETQTDEIKLKRDRSFTRNDDCYRGGLDLSYEQDFSNMNQDLIYMQQQAPSKMSYGKENNIQQHKNLLDIHDHPSGSGNYQTKDMDNKIKSFIKNESINTNQNFLKNPSQYFTNMTPNDEGVIEFKIDEFSGISGLQLIFSTPFHISCKNLHLNINESDPGKRDLSHKQNLQMDKFYSIFRNAVKINKEQEFIVKDITSTEISIVDTLSKIHDLQIEVSKYKNTYNNSSGKSYSDEWKFLKNWFQLSENEKLKKFNDKISHELNVFIYFKDEEFFQEVVKPHISNKIEKTLIDYFLLNQYQNAIDYYFIVERINSDLNAFEFCLLAYMLIKTDQKEKGLYIQQLFENGLKLIKFDREQWKKLFDIVLNQIEKGEESEKMQQVIEQNIQQNVQGRNHSLNSRMNNNFNNFNTNSNIAPMIQQAAYSNMVQNQMIVPQQMQQQQFQQMQQFGFGGPPPSLPQRTRKRSYDDYSNSIGSSSQSLCSSDEEEKDSSSDDKGDEWKINFASNRNRNVRLEKQSAKVRKPQAVKMSKKIANNDQFDPFSSKYQQESLNQQILNAYNPIGKTNEYCECHYYEKTMNDDTTSLVKPNNFWLDFLKHIIQAGNLKGFLSKEFIYSATTHTEMTFTLSVLDLPFQQKNHSYKNLQGKSQVFTPQNDCLVFTKEIKEAVPKLRQDTLVIQRFFDPKDRYKYEEDDPNVYGEKDCTNFIVNKIYGCQVIVTNLSIAQQQLQILYEIPEGAIPVYQIEYTRSQMKVIKAYNTEIIEYFFYFPNSGNCKVYPSNASWDGEVFAVAKTQNIEVKQELVIEKLETLNQILIKGSKDDILNFIETKNILNTKVFKFSEIFHLLKDKEFYLKLVAILRKKLVYEPTIWSYSIYHTDHQSLIEFLNHDTNKQKIGKYLNFIQTKLIRLPQQFTVQGGMNLNILEYYPLLNSRVHLLKTDSANILNQQFKKQYSRFLQYLVEKKLPTDYDNLIFVYYLLLQERIQDAIKIYKTIRKENLDSLLQYDYISAYLDFYMGYPNFKVARDVIEKYLDYPVMSWRNMFYEMANQLSEYDGDEIQQDELLDQLEKNQKKQKENQINADQEQILQTKIQGKNIILEHKNSQGAQLQLSYYIIDLEVFFSKKPFLSQMNEDFGYLKPSYSQKVDLKEIGENLNVTNLEIPQDIRKVNVYVQASVGNKKAGGIYFSTNLKIQIFENFGQMKVTDENDKSLSKVYIKVFGKEQNGTIQFHKDGYTDLRGRFDYLSLDSDSSRNYEKFAFFVMSDDLGSIIKEAKAPQKIGKQKENVQLIGKNWQNVYSNKIMAMPQQQQRYRKY